MLFRNLVWGKLTFFICWLTMLFNFSSRFITVACHFLVVVPLWLFGCLVDFGFAKSHCSNFQVFSRLCAHLFASLDGVCTLWLSLLLWYALCVKTCTHFLRSIYQFSHSNNNRKIACSFCARARSTVKITSAACEQPDMKCDGMQTKTTEPNNNEKMPMKCSNTNKLVWHKMRKTQ